MPGSLCFFFRPCYTFLYMPAYLLNLTDRQMDQLRERCQALGMPMSAFIRQTLDASLQSGAGMPCGVAVSGQIVSGYAMLIRVG